MKDSLSIVTKVQTHFVIVLSLQLQQLLHYYHYLLLHSVSFVLRQLQPLLLLLLLQQSLSQSLPHVLHHRQRADLKISTQTLLPPHSYLRLRYLKREREDLQAKKRVESNYVVGVKWEFREEQSFYRL
jgi:hypothetical protein